MTVMTDQYLKLDFFLISAAQGWSNWTAFNNGFHWMVKTIMVKLCVILSEIFDTVLFIIKTTEDMYAWSFSIKKTIVSITASMHYIHYMLIVLYIDLRPGQAVKIGNAPV